MYENSQIEFLKDLVIRLNNEVCRLKNGDFTEEEFQNLCHNMKVDGHPVTEDDICRFKTQCELYQQKLFGDK